MSIVMILLIAFLLKAIFIKSVHTQKFDLPKGLDALVGSCVVIPCKFTNSYPGAVVWFRDKMGKNIQIYNSNNSNLVASLFRERVTLVGSLAKDDCSIRINNLSLSDADHYFPQISSKPITKTQRMDQVYVTVQDPSKVIKISVPSSMTEEQKYDISCSINHACPNSLQNLKWDFAKKTINFQSRDEDLGKGQRKATIKSTYTPKSSDNGKILTCADNRWIKKDVKLTILYPPKHVSIRSSHKTGNVTMGDAVNLTCLGHGNPKETTVTWYKDNHFKQSSLTSRIFYIEEMTEYHSGDYFCRASNNIGDTESETVTLMCIDYGPIPTFTQSFKAGVVVVAVLLLVILSVAIVILYRKKKASRQPSPPEPAAEEPSSSSPIYMNMLAPRDNCVSLENPFTTVSSSNRYQCVEKLKVSKDSDLSLENPYTALQMHNRCPDYEQLWLQDVQPTRKPTLQASSSYSEYEEFYSFPKGHNRK